MDFGRKNAITNAIMQKRDTNKGKKYIRGPAEDSLVAPKVLMNTRRICVAKEAEIASERPCTAKNIVDATAAPAFWFSSAASWEGTV